MSVFATTMIKKWLYRVGASSRVLPIVTQMLANRHHSTAVKHLPVVDTEQQNGTRYSGGCHCDGVTRFS